MDAFDYVDRVSMNIKCRLAAKECSGLVEEFLKESKVDRTRFIEELIKVFIPSDDETDQQSRSSDMTDEQAKSFGQQLMPFGEFKNRRIDDIPLDRLDWYADQTFIDDLRNYLQSARIRQEREQS